MNKNTLPLLQRKLLTNLMLAICGVSILSLILGIYIQNISIGIGMLIFSIPLFAYPVLKRNIKPLTRAFHSMIEEQERLEDELREYTAKVSAMVEEKTKVLREKESRFHDFIENASDSILIFEMSGKLIYINPKGIEILCFDSAQDALASATVKNLMVFDTRTEKFFTELQLKNSVAQKELSFITKKKEHLTVEVSATLHLDAQSQTQHIHIILRDISEKKKRDEQQFRALKMEYISSIAGGLAHDFNNMLGGILGYASFSKAKLSQNDPLYHNLDAIEQSAIRAAEFTQKLMGFSRGASHGFQQINLNALVGDSLMMLEKSFDKTIAIQRRFASTELFIEGDLAQLEQMMLMLCFNARDAMPNGGVLQISTAHISVSEADAHKHYNSIEGDYAVITISDSGTGMHPDVQQRIFEPFFTTKDSGKGAGLGLATVYRTVHNHKGFITFQSELNKGTTFSIHIPIVSKRIVAEEKIAESSSYSGESTILIVDDEQIMRQILREGLEAEGYRTLEACNGIEAVQIFIKEKENIDLIILDMIMPKQNGLETFKQMKALQLNVPVILSSGYGENKQVQEMINEGVRDVLQKPYRVDTLTKKVKEILDE